MLYQAWYLSLSLSLPPLAELTQQELDVIPVTQSTYMQKNKLKFLLGKVDQLLGITPDQRKWTIKGKEKSQSAFAQYLMLREWAWLLTHTHTL